VSWGGSFDYDVALSGGYTPGGCTDAACSARPADHIELPGYAMKAVDRTWRREPSWQGHAALAKGQKGLILILVTRSKRG